MLSVNKDFQVRLAITRKGVSCRFQRERRGKQETRSQTRRCREAKGPSVLEPVRVIIIDLNLTRTPSSTGQGKEGADCRRRTLSTTAGVFPTRLDAESEGISETEITSVKARQRTRKTGQSNPVPPALLLWPAAPDFQTWIHQAHRPDEAHRSLRSQAECPHHVMGESALRVAANFAQNAPSFRN
jgi:hypothetical protein